MDVEHRLPGCLANIDPDVEALDAFVSFNKGLTAQFQELINGVSLGLMEVEIICDVATRYDQGMPDGNGVPILNYKRQFIFFDDPIANVAEKAAWISVPVTGIDVTDFGVVPVVLLSISGSA